MGRISEQRIQLRRDSPGVAWGFRLQGGSDVNTPLSVQRVFSGSPSDGQLQRGDVLVAVDGRSLRGMSPLDAQDLITSTGLVLNLTVQRGAEGGDPSFASQEPPQSSYTAQDNYFSGGSLPRSHAPPPGAFNPQSAPYQPSWAPSPQISGGQGSYQPPSQFGHGSANNFSPGGGAPHTNGGYDDYRSGGGGGGSQTYKSSATVFGGQGQGHDAPYGGSESGQRSSNGGFYGSEGSSAMGQQKNYENEEDDYERKSVSNIKDMFNKPDDTGPRAVGRIKGSRPKAPMYRANEDTSFTTPQYGPGVGAGPKSSLTPSRPGAVQRGSGPSSYVPPPVSNPAAGYGKKLYGYSQDSSTGPSRYTGGFVGVNELTKSVPQPVPVKKPPGQKKKDFDPSQSSVLRVVQEEEDRRKAGPGGPAGPGGQGGQPGQGGQGGYVNDYREPPRQQQQQQQQQQQRRGPPQQQRKTGQKWEDQQQHQQQRPTVSGKSGGPSLQALLERDQAQNPQEDPANNRVQYESQPQPSHGEYRRPGTTYKPAEHKVQAANVDDYPIPEQYLSGGRHSQSQSSPGYQSNYHPAAGVGYQSSAGYQGAGYQPTGGFQSSAKFSPGSGSGGGFSPRSPSGGGASGYPFGGGSADYGRSSTGGGGGGFYPSTNYGMDGIPASDF